MSTLPRDYARCAGVGSDDQGWREGCEDCLRRLAAGGEQHMEPPGVIVFECPWRMGWGLRVAAPEAWCAAAEAHRPPCRTA